MAAPLFLLAASLVLSAAPTPAPEPDEPLEFYGAPDEGATLDGDWPPAAFDPPSEPCPGPNSFRNIYGYCDCVDDFPYGEPDTALGCWKCEPFCHGFATCKHPGICECEPHYRGNGIDKCEPILPQILSIAPIEGFSDVPTRVNVSYLFEGQHDARLKLVAYCRFGLIPVTAERVTDTMIQCVAPARPPQQVIVAISFDSTHWSREHFPFSYKKKFELGKFCLIAVAYAAVVAGIGGFIWRVVANTSPRGGDGRREERQPFIEPAAAGATGKRKGTRKRVEI
jgi:hypothetical protein